MTPTPITIGIIRVARFAAHRRLVTKRHNYLDIEADELVRKRRQSLKIAPRMAPLDRDCSGLPHSRYVEATP
jgi:hypothetical protein